MIHYVTVAEDYVARHGKNPLAPVALTANASGPARHRADAARRGRRCDKARAVSTAWSAISAPRTRSSNSSMPPTLAELAAAGVSTPDLSIRIKTGPMVLPAPDGARLGDYEGR